MTTRGFSRLLMLASLTLVLSGVASAHTSGPCNDTGEPGNSDYAQHHVRPMAQDGDIGAVDHDGDGTAHSPGSHSGYSACDPGSG